MDVTIFPFQEKILSSDTPVTIAICGRSSGKSHGAAWWAIKKATECDGMGLVVAPTYQQAEVPIKYIMQFLSELGVRYTYNKTPGWAQSTLPSHSNILSMDLNGKLKQIKMASADVEDNLRSGSYSWVLIDEACYISEEAWQVVAPTLRGQGTNFNYQTLMISSPAGKNWLYNSFLETPTNDIRVIQAPSYENVLQVDDKKLKLWQATMSSRMYRQEILAEILDTNLNAIFYAYTSEIVKPLQATSNNLIVSLDQNVSPGAGVIIEKVGETYHVLDEIYIDDGANYQSYVREIVRKVPQGANITLRGDASGNARNVAALSTFYDSVITELKQLGLTVKSDVNRKNPKVYESREHVNMLIEQNRLFISSNCKHLQKDMEMAEWKADKVYETDKRKYDPHVAESLVYGVWKETPLYSQF